MLVETQDKALRRISELREQCSLEQQAKAHLEAALRMEMDEQQCIIETLKTKLSLHGENPDEIVKNGTENLITLNDVEKEQQSISDNNSGNLINVVDNTIESGNLTEKENQIIAGVSIINDSNDKIKALEAQLNAMKKQIVDEKNKSAELSRFLESSQKQIKELITREEENTILLAQNKLIIHSELENKEKEMKSLKSDAKQSASEKECLNEIVTELRELNSKANISIKELSEAKRSLQDKVEEMKKNAITSESDNKELRAKVIVLESEKQSILAKNALELEKFKARYYSLMNKNEQLEEITRTRVIECHEKLENELKEAKELNIKLSQQLSDEQKRLSEMLIEHRDTLKRMSVDFDSVKADKMKLESRFKQLFEEKSIITAELDSTKTQLTDANDLVAELKSHIEVLMKEQMTAKESIAKLEHNEEKNDSKSEVIGLKSKIDSLKNEKKDLEKTLDKIIREKSELQTQVTNILQEIGRLEEQLKDVKQNYSELEREKRILQEKSANQNTNDAQALTIKIKEFEMKLKTIECENSQLAEKNCLLEESNNRLQSIERDFESLLKAEKAINQELNDRISTLTLEIDSLKEENSRLQDKLKKSLDDYAELFNIKEQMDLEHRSLLDQIENREKEKLCVIDQQSLLEKQKCELEETCDKLKIELDMVRGEYKVLQNGKIELDNKCEYLNSRINDITVENNKFKLQNDSLQCENNTLNEKTVRVEELLNKSNNEKDDLNEAVKRLANIESNLEGYDQIKIENEYLNKSIKQLEVDVKSKYDEIVTLNNEVLELKEKSKSQQCELYVLIEEKRDFTKVLNEKDKEIEQLKLICQRSQVFSEELQNENKKLSEQLNTLKFLNDELQTIKDSLEFKYGKLNTELEVTKQSLDQQNFEYSKKHEEFAIIKSTLDESLLQTEEKLMNSQKELESCRAIISDLNVDLNDQSEKLESNNREIVTLRDKIREIEAKNDSTHLIDDSETMKLSYENLKYEFAETKRNNQREIAELNHEIDELREKVMVYHDNQSKLKTTNEILTNQLAEIKERQQQRDDGMVEPTIFQGEKAFSIENESNKESISSEADTQLSAVEQLKKEKNDLEQKMHKILAEVEDVSNRNLFLEQQCENYLILEQHNERLKLQNNKLSRQLDETLVCIFIDAESEKKHFLVYGFFCHRFQCTIQMIFQPIPNLNI